LVPRARFGLLTGVKALPSLFLLALLWIAPCLPGSGAETRRAPNFLLIVSDDQGYPDLGCMGLKEILTPNLDRLAREGVRLTSFYVTWPACTPSRGSILTGRYPQRNGLYDMIRNDMTDYGHKYSIQEYAFSPEMTLGMDLREVMISQVLKQAGYTTGAVGKWDGGRARRFLPLQRGFDFYYGFANTGIDYYTHERYGVPSIFRGNEQTEADKGIYVTDVFRREAAQFLRRSSGKPFFLYVAFNAPHAASNLQKDGVQAPDKYVKMYPKLDPNAKLTKYLAAVTCMDEAIGELLDALREAGLERDTLVIFHSDNGGSGNGGNAPLRGAKSTMWEGGLRVPFIARWPGVLPAGRVADDFLTSLEIFPTLVAAAGASPPPGIVLDGFDMLPVLKGGKPSPRSEMFWERRSDRAARVGSFKWVQQGNASGLFDLARDPGEKTDLSQSQPEVLARLKSRFDAWKQAMDQSEPRGPFRDY
jgi:arylsulfatase A-like enzyme